MAVRLLVALCTLAALAGAALAGKELHRVLTSGAPAALDVFAAAAPEPQPPQSSSRTTLTWPALFGEARKVEPQPPTPPQPPQPQAPPVSSLGYVLRGTVELSGETWAIVSHPTGERILRVGDALAEGVNVTGIDAMGLVLQSARGREVLEFAK